MYRENLGYVPDNLSITINEPRFWPLILFKVGLYLSFLITGLVLIRLFQQTSSDLYRFSTERFFKNSGIGLLTFIAVPLIILLLFVLVLTIPLSIILILLYGVALFFSYLLVAMILGVMSIQYFQDEATTSTYYWGLSLGMIELLYSSTCPSSVGSSMPYFFSLVWEAWRTTSGKGKIYSFNKNFPIVNPAVQIPAA